MQWTICSRDRLTVLFGIALFLGGIGSASAGTVSGWWGGEWTCNIDGRPAKMRWTAANDDQTECDGDVCTSASGAKWVGSFSDNGSAWVPLSFESKGSRGGFYFRHADGNRWYLPQPKGNRSDGWTTWNGQRYKLSCWR